MQAKSIYSTVLEARLIVELEMSLENMENINPNIYRPAELWLTRGQTFFSDGLQMWSDTQMEVPMAFTAGEKKTRLLFFF